MIRYFRNMILGHLRKAFPNHEEMLTDGLGTLIVYFLYATVVIILLPFILANKWFCIIDFSQSGQVGDTVGGIMGPFIALIAAFLTFMAFWIQYRANEKQNAIAQKQLDIAQRQMDMAEVQEHKYAIERFENTLNQMLDVYSKNSEAVNVGGLSGKEAFEELAAELFFIYYILDKKFRKLLLKPKYETKDEVLQQVIKNTAHSLWNDNEKYKMFLSTLAYELFFYGSNVVTLEKAYHKKDELLFAFELIEQVRTLGYHRNDNVSYRSLLKRLTTPSEEELSEAEYSARYQMAQGHNALLGHYYRQMLQIIKFVTEAPPKMFNEFQKYEYAKLLRSQLCDAEQILLYYNSLSVMGQAWNERHGTDDDDIQTWGYILRYRLIKNIPSNFPFFGIVPIDFYKNEIDKWKHMFGEDFFENEAFTKFGNSI